MASSGPRYPTATGQVARSPYDDIDWSNPSYITSDDNSRAAFTSSLSPPRYSYVLYASSFGFSIPDDAIVNGIKVEIGAKGGSANLYYVALRNTSSTPWGTAKNPNSSLSSTEVVNAYGGDSDTWGLTGLTGADINASDFGVELAVKGTSRPASASVDFLRVTVYYTEAAGGVPKHSDHYMRRRAA